jgi:hypothetical protein
MVTTPNAGENTGKLSHTCIAIRQHSTLKSSLAVFGFFFICLVGFSFYFCILNTGDQTQDLYIFGRCSTTEPHCWPIGSFFKHANTTGLNSGHLSKEIKETYA